MIFPFDKVYENQEEALGALAQNGSVLVEVEIANAILEDDLLFWEEHGSSDTILMSANPDMMG
jgi:hypothetical protein